MINSYQMKNKTINDNLPQKITDQTDNNNNKSRMYFIYAGVLFIMTIAAFSFVMFVMKPVFMGNDISMASERRSSGKIYSIGSVIVNVANTEGRRYLKTALDLEINNNKVVAEIESKRSQLIDIMINTLSSKSLDEVTSSDGKDRIKKELMDRLNSEIQSGRINRVFFTEFVVQ